MKNNDMIKESNNFNPGKINMEDPDYEIKIEGQVPITYASALNNRKRTIEKIKNDFKEKDKITNDFMNDMNPYIHHERKQIFKESSETKLYKRADNLADGIELLIQDISKINWEDFMTQSDFDILNKAVESLQGFSTAYSYVMDNEDIFENKNEPVCPECGKSPCICEKEDENESSLLTERGKVTPNLNKPRTSVSKKDKLYSKDDVWLKVYDELSSEIDNEGPNGEVYKQVDIPRGKRFVGPYSGPGDDDLTVYARTEDDLKWAKKIADHFGLKIEMKKDTNSLTNKYYPFYAILRNVSSAKVSDEDMKDYSTDK